MNKKILVGLGLVITFLIALTGCTETQTENAPPQTPSGEQQEEQTQEQNQSEQEQNQTQEENIIEMTAYDLAMEVQNDTLKTNAKYMNKTIRVTGIVNNTGVDVFGNTWVNLETGVNATFEKWLIHCTVKDNFIQEVANLSKGDIVTIQGIYKGTGLEMIWLNDCILIS